jgi:hypothetical protein
MLTQEMMIENRYLLLVPVDRRRGEGVGTLVESAVLYHRSVTAAV